MDDSPLHYGADIQTAHGQTKRSATFRPSSQNKARYTTGLQIDEFSRVFKGFENKHPSNQKLLNSTTFPTFLSQNKKKWKNHHPKQKK